MIRRIKAVDRIATALVGAGLLAGGAAVLWHRRSDLWADTVVPGAAVGPVTAQPWWPWAVATAGAVLVVVGLRWLLTPRSAPRAPRWALAPYSPDGALSADLTGLARATAAAVATDPAIVGAAGAATVEERRSTVTVTATMSVRHNLAAAAAAADAAAATAAAMTDGRVVVRTRLRVEARQRRRSMRSAQPVTGSATSLRRRNGSVNGGS